MSTFISELQEYSRLLKEGSVWANSKEILAPIISDSGTGVAEDNYIFEFYCYICIIIDLMNKYDIKFIEGKGDYKYKFPQAAAIKNGKPKFVAIKDDVIVFQICAGTKIDCVIDSEENHPDISFQLPNASDSPTEKDLIIIIDAKFKENLGVLPKTEVYKFNAIVELFELRKQPVIDIDFHSYVGFNSNCLITNGKAYSKDTDTRLLKKWFIKEVENFYQEKLSKL